MTSRKLNDHLRGRRIVKVKRNPFRKSDIARDGWAHNAEIILDDGSRLTFSVEETETGEYGIDFVYWPPKKAASTAA